MSKAKKAAKFNTKTVRIPKDLHGRLKEHVKSRGVAIEFWLTEKIEGLLKS